MRIFLAGATGAIGRYLTPLLVEAGHHVVATTRTEANLPALKALGVEGVVVDAFDREGVIAAVVAARPEIVLHQLTDLPRASDPLALEAALPRNARLRIEGTRNLADAAGHAGARRLIAQSVAFAYAPAAGVRREGDMLDLAATGARAETVRGVVALELTVLGAATPESLVLRYGRLYGPGTWFEAGQGPAALHVEAAAIAALLAVGRGRPGLYNIAEDDGAVSIAKARAELGFDPTARVGRPAVLRTGSAG